jgi:flagellar FliJ protein
MKFSFPFERLLEIRKRSEDLARKDHALAAQAVAQANAALKEMYEAIDQSRLRAGRIEREGGPRAAELAQIDDFIRGQGVRIERHRGKIRELMARAESLQEALVEAARERKTLEKLRERRWNEHKDSAKKRELRRLDELTTTRYKRPSEAI